MALSLTKSNELHQIYDIKIVIIDKSIKFTIKNKIIKPNKPIIKYNEKNKKLFLFDDNYENLEKQLNQLYINLKQYDIILNLLNFFESIILSKNITNNKKNILIIKLLIINLDINNCIFIVYSIKYEINLDKPINNYNFKDS